MEESMTMQQDLHYLKDLLFNNAVDLDDTMLDLDSRLCELPVWIDPFVEDGGSLVSELLNYDAELSNYDAELLNYDQRFSDFCSNATASYSPGFDSCSMELELSSIQEDLIEEIRIPDYDMDAVSFEIEQLSSVENNSENHVGWVETEPRDLVPTTGNSCQSNYAPNPSCQSNYTPTPSGNWDSENLISDCSDYRGVLTIHLLTACCEAISVRSHDLVEILLYRLKEMVSPTGSTIERVAFYLSQALQQLHGGDLMEVKMPKLRDMGALTLLNQVYPFIRIPHFTANQGILEAIKGPRTKLHIIDFDIMEGMQWPPLMEALKCEGYRIEHLKITALKWDCDENDDESDDDSVPLCTHTGRRLSEYAESLGIPFSFEETTLENMKTNKDEIVAVNCMWELPHMCERSRKSLMGFIHGGRQLNADILTIGTGPPDETHENLNLSQSFGECLRNLCAVFDCSEAGLPEQFNLARTKIENLFLAPMICRPLSYSSSKNGELGPLVMDIPLKCGFTPGEISKKNTIFAEQMFPIHYRVEFEGSHQILLLWHSTVLSRISVWKPINYNFQASYLSP